MADRTFLKGDDILNGLNATDIMNAKKYQDEGFTKKAGIYYDAMANSVTRTVLATGADVSSAVSGIAGQAQEGSRARQVLSIIDYQKTGDAKKLFENFGANLRVTDEDRQFLDRSGEDDISVDYVDNMGRYVEEKADALSRYLTKLEELPGLQPREGVMQGSFTENPSMERAIGTVSGGFASLGIAISAMPFAGPTGVASLFGLQAGGDVYQQGLDAGLDKGDAFTAGAKAGVVTATIEKVLGPFGREIGGHNLGRVVSNIVRGGAREGMTEGLQSLSQNFIVKTDIDAEQELFEGIAEAIVVGSITGGTVSGVYASANARAEKARQVMKDAGITDEQLDVYTTEVGNSIAKNNEALDAEFLKNIDANIDAMDNYTETELESAGRVKNFIQDQALYAGVDPELAESTAQLYEARSLASSRALGITPEEWLASWNLSIQGNNQEVMQGVSEEVKQRYDGLTPQQRAYFESDDYARNVAPGELFQDPNTYNEQGQVKTESPEFKAWFKGSKIVDDLGNPKVVYHGTPDSRFLRESGEFERSMMHGNSFFFTDSYRVADTYADDRRAFDYQRAEPEVMSFYIDMKNPMIVDAQGKKWRDTKGFIEEAREKGHDGIVIKNSRDEYNNTTTGGEKSTVYVAFDNKQIKSTENTGSFSPDTANIFYQEDVKDGYIRLYRGLEQEFNTDFDLSQSDAPSGYSTWTDNPELARQYAGSDGFVYSIDLPESELGKDYIDEDGERPLFFNNEKSAGLNDISGDEYLLYTDHELYNSNDIKQFNNQLNQGAKGSIKFAEDQTIISLFENADKSTILHETGHLFLRDISRVANLTDNAQVKQDYEALNKWLGSKDGVYTRKQEEKFARGFEKYLREGKAPSSRLSQVFTKFRTWLESVYQSAKDLNVNLTDDVRQVLDRALANETEIQMYRGEVASVALEEELYQDDVTPDKVKSIIEPLEFDKKDELLEELYQVNTPEERAYLVNEINNQIKRGNIERATKTNRVEIEDEKIDADLQAIANEDFKQDPKRLLKEKGLTYVNSDNLASKLFVPLSTRLNNINAKLKHTLRQFEFEKGVAVSKDMRRVTPFLEQMRKMQKADMQQLDFALKNGLVETRDKLLAKYNMTESFQEVDNLITEISERALAVGMEFGDIDNYFPREVSDSDAYITYLKGTDYWSNIEKALRQADPDNTFNSAEQATFINQIVNRYDLKEQQQDIMKSTKHTSSRTVTYVDPVANNFYKDSGQALIGYIESMNNTIEAKRFWGLDMNSFENSLGGVVDKMIENGELTRQQEIEFKKIIRARFNPTGPGGTVRAYKNTAYIYTMGNITSAITQIGDLGLSMYKNGLYNTGSALFSKRKIRREDLGIDQIAEEFNDESKSAVAVRKVFDAVGLSYVDMMFKNVNINASLMDMQKKARQDKNSKGYQQVKQLAIEAFDTKYQKVLSDLANGNITDDVKYLTFSRLSDLQPLNLTEMPEGYVTGGNARLFYMLKSYTIKQIDIYNNDIFKQMKTNPKQAMSNLIRLASALMVSGATSDVLKDLLLGREITLDDLVFDNILKLFGISKYQIYSAQRDGMLATALRTILPPVPFVDDAVSDLAKDNTDIEDWRIWGRIPVVGKEYYWWFGGGVDVKAREEGSF